MKKLLYFLLGFSLIVFPTRYLYAACVDAGGVFTPPANYYDYYEPIINLGVFTDTTCRNAAGRTGTEELNYYTSQNPSTPGWSTFYSSTFYQNGIGYSVSMKQTTVASVKNTLIYVVYAESCDGVCGSLGATDLDEDGIPDDCDVYPNDPTPYKVRTYSYQTDDNTSSGAKIYQWMHTDRGDSYDLGTKDPAKVDFLTYSSPWEDPPQTCTGINTEPENEIPEIAENPFTTSAPTGQPSSSSTNQDPVFKPGTESDGTETGDSLQREILTNTGKTATNTDRLGDYMSELTKAVQNMDRNVSRLAGGTGTNPTTDPGTGTALTAEDIANNIAAKWGDGTSDKTALQGVDEMGQGIGDINGTLTEGTDYTNPGPLQDEGFITDFLANSPIGSILAGSGFQTSGSVCSISFVLRGKTHVLSLCEFQAGFQAFGNVLFAFCGLAGILHLITGRSL